MRSRLASQAKNKNRMIEEKINDLVLIIFGTIMQNKGNPNGKANKIRNKSVKILLDSGASANIVHNSYVRKENFTKEKQIVNWSTVAGNFQTTRTAKLDLKLSELNSTANVTVKCHVTKQKSNYDLIIGRDTMSELGITLNFADNTTHWQQNYVKMKPINCDIKTHYTIRDSN